MATALSSKDAERRRQTVQLLEHRWSQAQVARHFGVTAAAVCQWPRAYQRLGPDALKARARPGAPCKLSGRQLKRLEQLLLAGPLRQGYATDLWTCRRIAELIEKHFGVSYDPSGLWHLLHRMGWSCQKPQRRARERRCVGRCR